MRPATATDKRQRAVYNIFKDALGIGKKATAEEIAVIDEAIERLRDGSMEMKLK